MSRAIINDVAERAGVSIKTVSRVMNRETNVSETTRKRVLDAAAELDYHPSLSARGLAGHKSYLIALLYDNPSPSYLAGMQKGILDICHENGFGLMLQPVDSESSNLPDEIERILQTSKPDGVILTPPLCDRADLIRSLKASGVSAVSISPPEPAARNSVMIDDRRAATEMTRHLIGLGHRRIGFIKAHPAHGAGSRRFEGYLDALRQAGIARDDTLIEQGYFSFESGKAAADRLLDREKLPTAIFASNDDMAAGVIHAARQRGLDVPGDLSVAGFDDTRLSHMIWPALTTVHQPILDMGQCATRLLIGQIRREGAANAVELPFSLVLRSSCASPR